MATQHTDAQRAPTDMQRKRREAVDRIAERNRKAHQEAKQLRAQADERRRRLQGPDAR